MNFAHAVDSIERVILNVKSVQEQDSEQLLERTYSTVQKHNQHAGSMWEVD